MSRRGRSSRGRKRAMSRGVAILFAVIGLVLAEAAHLNHSTLGVGMGVALIIAAIVI